MLSAQLPLGNTKRTEAATPGCFGKTSKLHRSKQPQQFFSLKLHMLTDWHIMLVGCVRQFHCHNGSTAFSSSVVHEFCALLSLFFLSSFSSTVKETSASFLENLRHLDEKLIFSYAVFLLQLLLLRSIRPEVPLFPKKVLCHCTAAFDRYVERRIYQKFSFS